MDVFSTVRITDILLLVTLICSCLCHKVNSEECKKADDTHCHCRTDSGYEIDLSPLASNSGPR